MENINMLLLFITAHILGDYVFQSEYIALTKAKSLYHLIVHCWIYTFFFWIAFVYLNVVNIYIIAFVFVSHFLIDFIKNKISIRNNEKSKIYYALDQVLHYLMIAIVSFCLCFGK